MNRVRYILSLAIILLMATVSGAVSIQDMNYLQDISSLDSAKHSGLVMDLDLKSDLPGRSVQYSQEGHYILVTLPDTYVNPPKRTFTASGLFVEEIFAAQRNSSTTNVKIVLSPKVRIDPYGIRDRLEDGKLRLTIPITGDMTKTASRFLPEKMKNETTEKVEPEEDTPIEKESVQVSASDTKLKSEIGNVFKEDLAGEFADGFIREEALVDEAPDQTAGVEADEDPFAALLGRDTKASEKEKVGNDAPSLGWSAMKMFAALLVVAGLIVLLGHLMKKYNLNGKRFGMGESNVRVLATHNLGLKRSIQVVDIAGEVIVLSASGNDVRMLTKIENPEAVNRLRGLEPEELASNLATENVSDFGKYLNRAQSESTEEITPPPVEPEKEISPGLNAIRQRIANLRKM